MIVVYANIHECQTKVATLFCSWIFNDVGVSCLLKNSTTSACISRSQFKTLEQCFPQECLNLLTKHKLLTDQLVKVRWDKNEPIGGNLDERDEAKSRVEGAMFSRESWFCWSGNNLWKQFFILTWGWACSSLLYLEGFWSIRPLSISLKAALKCLYF